jgi:hypothetical protein
MTFDKIRDLITLLLAILGSVSGVWAYVQKRSFKQQQALVDQLAKMTDATLAIKDKLEHHINEDSSIQATIATTLKIWTERLDREENRRQYRDNS